MSGLLRPRGWRRMAALVLLGAVTAVAEPPAFMQRPSQPHVRVLSYNVNWDAIFPDDDPNNHPWRNYDKSAEFVRVVQAVQPDIVCIQELNGTRSPQDLADILDAALPLPNGAKWRSMKAADNFTAARFDLLRQRDDTIPSTTRRQAMALVDLPDTEFPQDLYLINAHYKSGGGSSNIDLRQLQADATVSWYRELRRYGGVEDLPFSTPIIALGDQNVYDTDPAYHLTTLLTGDIVYDFRYGADSPPDWDGTNNFDVLPLHNGIGPEFYTWRQDGGGFNPGDLDHITYTDSVLDVLNSFVLNTVTMSSADLAAAGLQANDVVLWTNGVSYYYDHLPLVVDFGVRQPLGDLNRDSAVNAADLALQSGCMNGPNVTTVPSGCDPNDFNAADQDGDGDVDLHDAARLLRYAR